MFAPADVDMMSVRAVFEANGELRIHIRRRFGAMQAYTAGGERSCPLPVVLTQ